MRKAFQRILGHMNGVQQLDHAFLPLSWIEAAQKPEGCFQDLPDCLSGIERRDRILKHILYDLAKCPCAGISQFTRIAASNRHRTTRRLCQSDKHSGERAFARSAFTDDRQGLTASKIERNIFNRLDFVTLLPQKCSPATEGFCEIANADCISAHPVAFPFSRLKRPATRSRKSAPCPSSGTQAIKRFV